MCREKWALHFAMKWQVFTFKLTFFSTKFYATFILALVRRLCVCLNNMNQHCVFLCLTYGIVALKTRCRQKLLRNWLLVPRLRGGNSHILNDDKFKSRLLPNTWQSSVVFLAVTSEDGVRNKKEPSQNLTRAVKIAYIFQGKYGLDLESVSDYLQNLTGTSLFTDTSAKKFMKIISLSSEVWANLRKMTYLARLKNSLKNSLTRVRRWITFKI